MHISLIVYSLIRENIHYVFHFSFVSPRSTFFPIYIYTENRTFTWCSCVFRFILFAIYGILLAPFRMTDVRVDVSRVTILFEVSRFSALCVISDIYTSEKSEASPPRRHGHAPTWLQIVQVSSTTNQVLWTARLSRNPDVCVHAWSSSWCFRCSFRIDTIRAIQWITYWVFSLIQHFVDINISFSYLFNRF